MEINISVQKPVLIVIGILVVFVYFQNLKIRLQIKQLTYAMNIQTKAIDILVEDMRIRFAADRGRVEDLLQTMEVIDAEFNRPNQEDTEDKEIIVDEQL